MNHTSHIYRLLEPWVREGRTRLESGRPPAETKLLAIKVLSPGIDCRPRREGAHARRGSNSRRTQPSEHCERSTNWAKRPIFSSSQWNTLKARA